LCADRELSLQDCRQQYDLEMAKAENCRDVPRLLKLWSHKEFYKHRREAIASWNLCKRLGRLSRFFDVHLLRMMK